MEDSRMSFKMILLFMCCIVLVMFPSLLIGQNIDGVVEDNEYVNEVTFDGGLYELSWNIDGSLVYIAMSARTTGWVAIGFDPITLMENADMVFGWVDESGTAFTLDTFATGPYGPHPPDEELGGMQDIVQFAGIERDGITTIEFSRNIETGDEYDKPLEVNEGVTVIWAYSDSDEYTVSHEKSGYGWMGPGEGKVRQQGLGLLLVFHNVALSVAFFVMIFAMIIARYMKKRRWWMRVHRLLEITGVILSVAGIIAVEYIVFSISGDHFRIMHSYIGFVAILLLILAPIFGQLILKGKKERKRFFRVFHRWLGRIALLTTLAAIIYGLIQIQIL